MTAAIRLLLVDDHPVVRDGLRAQLDAETDLAVVAVAASAEEALAVLGCEAVDVVVTDLRMPGRGGVELVREVRAHHPSVEILVLTTYDTDDDVASALAAGATGYLLKDAPRATVVGAVHDVARGRTVLAPSVAGRAARGTEAPEPVLSDREIEVLALVAAGRTNRDIGRALFIGESTAKTHVQHILAKLEVRDRAAAVAAGYRRGLL
ncbi:response regulator [Georgenia sp. Z1344]|uniref:response regulator n=1 Tax=Georgenia sp. Z1344 TaxID=3416706 RepID=UPI003CE9283A